MPQTISFESLPTANLIVDAIYEGDKDGQLATEPISNLLPGCGNMGGFRIAGKEKDKLFVALFTTGEDKDWPDTIDLATGQFIYYGDNKKPGHELHDTHKGGTWSLSTYSIYCTDHRQTVNLFPLFSFSKSA